MQVDNFTFQDHVALPASLRYVAIYNEAFELLRPIGALLKVCRWGLCALHHKQSGSATRWYEEMTSVYEEAYGSSYAQHEPLSGSIQKELCCRSSRGVRQ